jgi:hypothetical protein
VVKRVCCVYKERSCPRRWEQLRGKTRSFYPYHSLHISHHLSFNREQLVTSCYLSQSFPTHTNSTSHKFGLYQTKTPTPTQTTNLNYYLSTSSKYMPRVHIEHDCSAYSRSHLVVLDRSYSSEFVTLYCPLNGNRYTVVTPRPKRRRYLYYKSRW